MSANRILITGFEPFGSMDRNPSTDVVKALRARAADDSLITEILPVEYRRAQDRIDALLQQYHPIAWLGLGLSQRATAITLERVAVNLDDATIADNGGELRRGQPIDLVGDDAYRSTLPLEEIAAELGHRKIPHTFSDTAGRFVCNHVFYHTLATIRQSNPDAIAGFIHIPWPSDWGISSPTPHSVTLVTMSESAHACVDIILREIRRRKILAT